MPVYEYACTECGEQLEVRQSFTDAALTVCPACSGRLRKVLSPVGVVFKGSGFYRNDSRAAANGSGGGDSKDGKDGKKEKDGKKDKADSPAGATASSGSDSSNGSASANGKGGKHAGGSSSTGNGSSHGSSTAKAAAN